MSTAAATMPKGSVALPITTPKISSFGLAAVTRNPARITRSGERVGLHVDFEVPAEFGDMPGGPDVILRDGDPPSGSMTTVTDQSFIGLAIVFFSPQAP